MRARIDAARRREGEVEDRAEGGEEGSRRLRTRGRRREERDMKVKQMATAVLRSLTVCLRIATVNPTDTPNRKRTEVRQRGRAREEGGGGGRREEGGRGGRREEGERERRDM